VVKESGLHLLLFPEATLLLYRSPLQMTHLLAGRSLVFNMEFTSLESSLMAPFDGVFMALESLRSQPHLTLLLVTKTGRVQWTPNIRP
jgi:hypothetical protein